MAIVASSTFPAVVIALRAGAAGELALDAPRDPPPDADQRPQAPGLSGARCGGPVRSGCRNRFLGSGYRTALPPEAARIGRSEPKDPPLRRIRGGSPAGDDSGRKRATSGDSRAGNRAGPGLERRS
jgi:hypothetical protein